MTKDFRARNLIKIEQLEEYDGTTAMVATEHLPPEEIEYERWRVERWMKTRHIPAVIAHEPFFVMRHWWKMLTHTFRGTSLKSAWDWKATARSSGAIAIFAARSGYTYDIVLGILEDTPCQRKRLTLPRSL